MTKVVSERGGLRHVRVQSTELIGECLSLSTQQKVMSKATSNLSDFENMGKTIVKNVPFGSRNNLRNATQTAQGSRMQDSVSIPLEFGSGRVDGFIRVPPLSPRA